MRKILMVTALGLAACSTSGNGGATGAAPDRYMGERSNVAEILTLEGFSHSLDPEPAFSRHWPTRNMLRQVVEEVGTAAT